MPKALAGVQRSDIRAAVGSTIYQRGEQYYASGAVEDIAYTDSLTLEATVSGSEFYSVQLYLDNDGIEAECDCPYDGGTCKHVVAVLLEAITEGDSIRGCMDDEDEEISAAAADDNKTETSGVLPKALPLKALKNVGMPSVESSAFRSYVESLSVQELRDRVLRYSPEEFRRTVLTRSLNQDAAERVMNAAERTIRKIFENEYLRHNNSKLETELLRECERVRGLWEKFPDRVATMLIMIIQMIDSGFEEGDFYEDYYDEGFSSAGFNEYVVQFIRSVPVSQKSSIVADFEDALSSTGFSAFMNIEKRKAEWFTQAEIPALKKDILAKILAHKYNGNAELDYKTISAELDDDEREEILQATYLTSNALTLELVQFYEQKRRFSDALDAIDKRMKKFTKEGYIISLDKTLVKKRCELAARLKESPKNYAKQAQAILQTFSTADIVQSVCRYIKECGEKELLLELEQTAEARNPQEFFRYLDAEGRVEECWERITKRKNIYENIAYEFAVKHLREDRERADNIILQRIEKNKPIANESAYMELAEALKHLSEIDDEQAGEILLDLRTNYKRRSNLMKQLDKAFPQQRRK